MEGRGDGAVTPEIRAYQDADHDACRALWVELTERHRLIYDDPTIGGDDPGAYLDTYLATPERVGSWVAVQEGETVGLTGLFVRGDSAEVEPVVVTERLRGQGIGQALLDAMIDEARSRGLPSLSIRPVARNVEAIALFWRAGFRTMGHLDLFLDLVDRDYTWRDGLDVHGLPVRY